MTRSAIAAAVLLVGSLPEAAAGHHPDRFGVHAVVLLYEESDLYRGGGASWRKRMGRGWGLHAVYDVSTPGDYWDGTTRPRCGAPRALGRRTTRCRTCSLAVQPSATTHTARARAERGERQGSERG